MKNEYEENSHNFSNYKLHLQELLKAKHKKDVCVSAKRRVFFESHVFSIKCKLFCITIFALDCYLSS